MLSCNESSNNDWESSGSQNNNEVDVIAQGKLGSSNHDPSMQQQRSKRSVGPDNHKDEMSENDDDSGHPSDPPAPEADPHLREITHDTDIRLKILVNGEDRGDFLELETSIKVCSYTQRLESSLTRYSSTLSLTRRNYRTTTRA